MTSIERTRPQAPKEFNPDIQDHGTAARRKGHQGDGYYWEKRWDERGAVSTDKTYLKEVIRDGLASTKTQEELDAEADAILAQAESDSNADWFEAVQGLRSSDDSELDHQTDDYHLNVSEAELGIQSLRAKRKDKEQAATLDPAYAEDDTEDYYETGRSVYKIPVTQEDRKRNY